MIQPKHTLSEFEEALGALRSNVLLMASLTTRSLTNALQGLRDRNDDLCLRAIADDEEIDQLEKQMDRDGVELLIRFQPVASDLRRVVSAMKLSPNLERIGDESVSVARKARKLNQHPSTCRSGTDYPARGSRHGNVPRRRRRLLREDVEQGRALQERDKGLDAMNKDVARTCLARIGHDPEQLRGYLNLDVHCRASRTHRRSRHQHRRGCGLLRGRGRYPASSNRSGVSARGVPARFWAWRRRAREENLAAKGNHVFD